MIVPLLRQKNVNLIRVTNTTYGYFKNVKGRKIQYIKLVPTSSRDQRKVLLELIFKQNTSIT
jgi:hypothetical protein